MRVCCNNSQIPSICNNIIVEDRIRYRDYQFAISIKLKKRENQIQTKWKEKTKHTPRTYIFVKEKTLYLKLVFSVRNLNDANRTPCACKRFRNIFIWTFVSVCVFFPISWPCRLYPTHYFFSCKFRTANCCTAIIFYHKFCYE